MAVHRPPGRAVGGAAPPVAPGALSALIQTALAQVVNGVSHDRCSTSHLPTSRRGRGRAHLTQSASQVVLQKSIPVQIRRLNTGGEWGEPRPFFHVPPPRVRRGRQGTNVVFAYQFFLRILVHLVVYESGQVSLERLLLSWHPPHKAKLTAQLYLTESVFKVVLQMSTPPQIRQLILHYYQYKEKNPRPTSSRQAWT